jgi:hypothetical protein
MIRFLRFWLEASFLAIAIQVFLLEGKGCGDRPEVLAQLPYSIGAAFVLAIVGMSIEQKNNLTGKKLHHAALWFVRYYLAYIIIGYGAAKMIDLQFHNPLVNLDIRLGDVPAMSMVWAFFGYSYPYNAFLGISQIGASLLLFNRRTATLGACIMVAILSNIVVVNFCYDICVKLFSSTYLAMAFYILSYDALRFWKLFITNQAIEAKPKAALFSDKFPQKWVFAANTLVALLLVGHQLNLILGHINSPATIKPPTYGAWDIQRVQVGDFIDEIKPDSVRWRRMFFDEGNFVNINSEYGTVANFTTTYNPDNNQVELRSAEDPNQVWTGKYEIQKDGNNMIFRGLNGSDSIFINLRKIPNYKR